MQRFIDELRARISIADVVGAKVKLTKKGREYQGLCPFHHEKTPSFTVNESKGFYHCFGCGAHGDIIRFEMEANGLPFLDALQKLSHQAGLQMPQLSPKDKKENDERKSLYEIMESACVFFERELQMPDGTAGLRYFMDKRGLSKETIHKFRLGFSPNNNALMTHLKTQGISEKDMKELGLIAFPEDTARRPHDFFRNRVMIPITNKQGKIIAFGGRVMEKLEPKYLNSPDTPIFNKRRNLYNLDKAREIAYKEKKLIICEGYMDVIALDRYGFGYAVAPLGTALTEEQIAEAWRVCPEPILCLDGDAPGVKAAMRAVDRVLPMLKAGYSLKFLFLPDNQDPDEYLQAHGHDSFAALMSKTSPLIDILWRKYTEDEDSSTPEKKALIEKTLLAEVAKISDTTVKSYYAQEIRNRIFTTFKQTAWTAKTAHSDYLPSAVRVSQRQKATSTACPDLSLSHASQKSGYSLTNSAPDRFYPKPKQTDNNFSRRLINHNFGGSPETLRRTLESETDKNIRFILAAMLIYPELIDDYEERLFSIDIKNENFKKLLSVMYDIYRESESNLSSAEFRQKISEQQDVSQTLMNLWEVDMLQKRNPFINDMRQNIDRLLTEDRLRVLEEDIKSVSAELVKNFTEEAYLRQKALKKERDDILATAAEPND